LRDAATDRVVAKLEDPHGDHACWMSFTPDGTQLVVNASYARAIRVWDLRAIRQRLKGMKLDWDWPEFPPAALADEPGGRFAEPALRVRVMQAEPALDAVTKKELERLQGTWSLVSMEVGGQQISDEDKSFVFVIKGDKWSLHVNGQLSQAGTVQQIEVRAKHNAIDLPITEGANAGTTATAIYAVDGDLMRYLNCAEPRATEFTTKPGDGRCYSILRRVKP
jgi:uncharacterized protein (TIGR03067 family)